MSEPFQLSPYWNTKAVQQLRREIRTEDAQKVLDNAAKQASERNRRNAKSVPRPERRKTA